MPIRRHPLRTIFLYEQNGIWWRKLREILTEEILKANQLRSAPGFEHWKVKPGPSAAVARRQTRVAPAIFIADSGRLNELMKALQYRAFPVHVIYESMKLQERSECQKQGWQTWRIADVHPHDIVKDVLHYCYPEIYAN